MSHSLFFWCASMTAACVPVTGALVLLDLKRTQAEQITRRVTMVTENFASASDPSLLTRPHRDPLPSIAFQKLEQLVGYDRTRRAHRAVAIIHVLAVAIAVSIPAGLFAYRAFGTLGWFIVIPLTMLGPRFFYARCDARYSSKLFQQFPDALGMIIRAVRVGVGVGNAILIVAEEAQAPTSSEFRQLAEEITIGRPLGDALRAMGARNHLPEYRFFATALSLQSQTGGGLTDTLETLGDTIRKRVAIRSRGHALASEARLSCYVLCALPFVVGGFLYLSNRAYLEILFTTRAGERLLGFAIAMLGLGMFSMQTMTKRVLR